MVEDRITDGTRIAQLLASELTGLQEGPLEAVEVTDADPDATGTPTGMEAYRVAFGGDPMATVVLYPDAAVLRFEREFSDSTETLALPTDERREPRENDTGRHESAPGIQVEGREITLTDGAAVKRAVDIVRLVLAAQ